MKATRKYLTLFSLILGQGLSGTVISLLTLTSALVGKSLAPTSFLATLPITMTILGSAFTIYFASLLMSKYGRKTAFIFSGIIGLFATFFAIGAIYLENFVLFLISTFILGGATVFNQYYRFAAAEIFDSSVWQKRATALVISGGIIGGITGPYLASKGIDLIPDKPFLGNFLCIFAVFILLIISQFFVFIDKPIEQINTEQKCLKDKEKYSPYFIFGTLSCSVGFGLMTLVMNAAPLSMHNHCYPIAQNASALQWHFVAMYLPSLFFPFILKRVKTSSLILLGNSSFFIGAMAAFCFKQYSGYFFSLLFAGIGWAFMFTGGTFYLNQLPVENKHQQQGKSAMMTYLVNVCASFSVGLFLILDNGWLLINSTVIFASFLFFIFYKRFKKQLIP